MFERNRIDNTLQQIAVPVEITLADGSLHKGKFIVAAAPSVYEVLNGDTKFLEFETYDGNRTLLAKSTIAAINLVAVPSASGLRNKTRDADQFDPRAILGVDESATWDDIRKAYVRLSKIYHPDVYTSVALPTEVQDYLAAMSRRLNAAYRALEMPEQAAKRAVIEKAKPVFTSSQRL